jgi:mono/diheme cytochrome c family protein
MAKNLCAVLTVASIGMCLAPAAVSAQQGTRARIGGADSPSAEILARGRYMVITGHCNNCHTAGYQQRAGKISEKDWLTGRDIGHRGPWGTTYPTNLRVNVNRMSEEEWVSYASTLRARPGMPSWSLRDTNVGDLRAMYQFIKSLGSSDVPSRQPLPPGQEPQTLYIRVVPAPKSAVPPLNVATEQQKAHAEGKRAPSVPLAEGLARGRYMLVTGHCNNCHTENYGALEGNVPEKDWVKGSRTGHRGSWGTTYPTNLRANVGFMAESQWVAYARSVRSRPPMPWWAVHETTAEDLSAMYQFIKNLGPAGEPAPAFLPPDREPTPPYTHWPAIFPE